MKNSHSITAPDANAYNISPVSHRSEEDFEEIQDENPWEILSGEMNKWSVLQMVSDLYSDM